jgi:uncharacterized protein involved in response to NO
MMHRVPLAQISDAARPARHDPGRLAVLQLGFRPFYLLGAAAAALLPVLWILMLTGFIDGGAGLSGPLWHGHEMLFGFAMAVVVGFLLTAGRLWTGLTTPSGGFLAALAALWLSGRIASLSGPYALYFLLDIAFLPLVAAIFGDLVLRSRNWRNAPMAGLLVLLAAANLLFHLGYQNLIGLPPSTVLRATVALIVSIEAIVAGRVIPAFIGSAVPGSHPRVVKHLEAVLLPASAVGFVSWLVAPHHALTTCALLLLGGIHALRLLMWRPWAARGRPILWILPLAYAWIPLGIVLLALASLGWISESAGLHALTAGSMGGLIAAMITRTSRGHTGRPMVAGRSERLAYVLVIAGAAFRVAGGLMPHGTPIGFLVAAALLWAGAFALILATISPWLLRPRIDGKEG